MTRIGWQSNARARQLHELLDTRLAHWKGQWCAGPPVSLELCAIPDLGNLTDQPPMQVVHWTDTEHSVALVCSDALALPLGRDLLQQAVDAGLATDVGTQAIKDLAAQLFDIAPLLLTEAQGGTQLPRYQQQYGGLLFRLRGFAQPLWLALSRVWCDHQPGQSSSSHAYPSLVDRRQAVGTSALAARAYLPLGEIGLFESLNLQIGEILVTDVTCEAQVHLRHGHDGPDLVRGNLRAAEGQRCVQLN